MCTKKLHHELKSVFGKKSSNYAAYNCPELLQMMEKKLSLQLKLQTKHIYIISREKQFLI